MIILAEKVSEFEGFCALKRGENILLKVKIDGKSNLTVNKGTLVIKKHSRIQHTTQLCSF